MQATQIVARNYLPSNEDVLRVRAKTMAIMETRFSMGQLLIHMVNVSGQHSEQKKWIHNFESVTSIMFCTALLEYNQVLPEEKNQVCKQIIVSQVPTNQWPQNWMAESLVLFELVINSWWFLHTLIILFLDKIDVFKGKLPKVPLCLPVTTFPPFPLPHAYYGLSSFVSFIFLFRQPRHLPFHYHASPPRHLPTWLFFIILIANSDSLCLPSYLPISDILYDTQTCCGRPFPGLSCI